MVRRMEAPFVTKRASIAACSFCQMKPSLPLQVALTICKTTIACDMDSRSRCGALVKPSEEIKDGEGACIHRATA